MPKQKVDERYVVKQSLKVFRSKGYNHTSMQDIADACELQKGSLYHYFKSKEALMHAVIEYMHTYFTREAFKHAYDETLGNTQKLQILADICETQYFTSGSGCLFGNLALETAGTIPELSSMVKDFFTEWVNALQHIFSSKFDAATAQTMAQDSLAEIEGAVMMMRIFNDRNYLRRANARIVAKID